MTRFTDLALGGCAVMLAQVPSVSPGDLGSWLLSGAAVMVILTQAMQFVEKFRNSMRETPAPSATYMPRQVCEAIHKQYEGRMAKVEAHQDEISATIRSEFSKTHERIDRLLDAIAGAKRIQR